jgi:hypothetical protein
VEEAIVPEINDPAKELTRTFKIEYGVASPCPGYVKGEGIFASRMRQRAAAMIAALECIKEL